MKLKIKVKTLIGLIVGTLVLILVIVPLGNLRIGIYLNGKGSDKSQAFFKNYMASPIKLNEKQGLYEYGNSLVDGFEKYKISFSGWGGGGRARPENMEDAMELFEQVLEKDKKNNYEGHYSTQSYSKLLDTSIATLDMDRLFYWIEWGRDKENQEINHMSQLYEAYYYFVKKDYIGAKEILDYYDKEGLGTKYYHLMGDIQLRLGNIEEAKEYYNGVYERGPWIMKPYFGGSDLYINEDDIETYIDKSKGDYTIKGKVSYNGQGLPFVEVYVSDNIGAFRMGGEKPDAITDENGEFETLGLKQGVYDIAISIHPSQVYNRVFLKKDIRSIELNKDMEYDFDFVAPIEINDPKERLLIKDGEGINISWDEVKGADYYKVESLVFSNPKEKTGSWYSMPFKDENGDEKIRDNSMILNIENSRKTMGGYTSSGEEGIVDATGILGSFIPQVEYPLIVNAYDKEDNQISSSLTLISDYKDIISVEVDGGLSKGEKFILDMKYEKAISHYQERLIENPKDKEALFYLTRIYSIGWKVEERNLIKALKYAEVYDREYKDHNLSLEVVSFMGNKEMRKNKEKVREILEGVPENQRDTNYYRDMANYYLIEEDYEKARENYDKMTDYKSSDIVYIDMYLGHYEKAISTLENGELYIVQMNTGKLIEGLKAMDNISEEDKDLFERLLKSRLDNNLNLKEERELYRNTLKSVNSKELKGILKEIAKEAYW